MAHLRPHQLSELQELYDQATAVVRWLMDHEQLPHSGSPLLDVLDDTRAAQNLRGMRMAARDIREMLSALTPSQRAQIEADLGTTPRATLRRSTSEDQRAAAAILERGHIRNDREYYLLRARLGMIEGEPTLDTEAQAITALLDRYRQ